ncbi:MAG: hypothetical protein JNJ83_18125 [Verrucomicrobiaceae bacterium]|nr:hypothetical protein [Verrucomicrobiaceae bacterium]
MKPPSLDTLAGAATEPVITDSVQTPVLDEALHEKTLRWSRLGEMVEPTAPISKVKMNLTKRTDLEFLSFVKNHLARMVDNPDFEDPQPPEDDMNDSFELYKEKLQLLQELRALVAAATVGKDKAREALTAKMVTRGAYVQTASKGNPFKIRSAGLDVVKDRSPIGALPPPTNIRAYLSEFPGMMLLRWDGVENARGYLVEYSLDEEVRVFRQLANTTKTSLRLDNLIVGQRLVFRLATQGGKTGQSPWSAEMIRTVG